MSHNGDIIAVFNQYGKSIDATQLAAFTTRIKGKQFQLFVTRAIGGDSVSVTHRQSMATVCDVQAKIPAYRAGDWVGAGRRAIERLLERVGEDVVFHVLVEAEKKAKSSQSEQSSRKYQQTMETKPPPFADILHAIANGEQIQYRYTAAPAAAGWTDTVDANDALQRVLNVSRQTAGYSEYEFRVKPRTITINGREVQRPLREAPEKHESYYAVSIGKLDGKYWNRLFWENDRTDQTMLANGLVHLTPEAAQAHAEALLSFTTTTP